MLPLLKDNGAGGCPKEKVMFKKCKVEKKNLKKKKDKNNKNEKKGKKKEFKKKDKKGKIKNCFISTK